MAQIKPPTPVKLFVGVLTSIPSLLPEIEERLSALFGHIDSCSDLLAFDQTHYYDEEMGSPLHRRFFSFSTLMDPSEIAGIKIKTNELEAAIAAGHSGIKRPANLDPGYLEQSKIVLASTKNFFHRILVSSGIYAEVTLHYRDGRWQHFPWTFPDYKSGNYRDFFASLRELYRKQLRAAGFPIRHRGDPEAK